MKSYFLAGILIWSTALSLPAAPAGASPNLLHGDFESGQLTFNPWGGIDMSGNVHVWDGQQLAVNDSGAVKKTPFSPSVAVGDLNGDGLPDLVVADARGYFWYFPNSGKPHAPVFTHGEIIPVWLSDSYRTGDVVPRIQLVDYDGDGKLDLVAGNYAGQLYFIHNNGSSKAPSFGMLTDRARMIVPTHKEGQLWCNFLSPFLYDFIGSGRLDLVMGDGSYSANSIFLFTNKGTKDGPTFNENFETKMIPGMGREHLTPQVVDWNNDGKPDIIAGERSGYINVYLNQAPDKSSPPVFDKDNPLHVKFGSRDKIGTLTTVCAADINQDKLFDLIVSGVDGRISYALNTGTPGAPKFGEPVPFKGTNPFPNIMLPASWAIDWLQPYGIPFGVLECTNATLEKGFQLPPDFAGKGALKFSVFDTHAIYFPKAYVPADNPPAANPRAAKDPDQEDEEEFPVGTRQINYKGSVDLETDSTYDFNFLFNCTGSVSNLAWHMRGSQPEALHPTYLKGPIDSPTSWTRIHSPVNVKTMTNKTHVPVRFSLWLTWQGDGTLYFDDFTMKKSN